MILHLVVIWYCFVAVAVWLLFRWKIDSKHIMRLHMPCLSNKHSLFMQLFLSALFHLHSLCFLLSVCYFFYFLLRFSTCKQNILNKHISNLAMTRTTHSNECVFKMWNLKLKKCIVGYPLEWIDEWHIYISINKLAKTLALRVDFTV